MCGRMNVTDDPRVILLMEMLGMPLYPDKRYNIAPGAYAQFVIEQAGKRTLMDGMWSLLIEPKPHGDGFRPNPKWKTFNAKAERLNNSPLWKKRFARQRAIIPVSGFHEWLGKQCFQITAKDQALALAGLYELWQFDEQFVPSFTVITLGPHLRFSAVHDKSIPLILTPKDFDAWLDPDMSNTDVFADLTQTHLAVDLQAVPIKSPDTLEPNGEPIEITADEDAAQQ